MASPARRERDSQVGFWIKGVYLQVLSFLLSLCPLFFLSNKSFFCVPNDFADKHAVESNFSFVNKESIITYSEPRSLYTTTANCEQLT